MKDDILESVSHRSVEKQQTTKDCAEKIWESRLFPLSLQVRNLKQIMITGKVKNQVDAIWMSFWTGGITNSIDVLEQLQNEITEAMNEFKTKYMNN